MINRELRDAVFGIRELSTVCRFDSCLTGLESAVKVFFRGTTRREGHRLAREVFYGRRGELRQRYREGQEDRDYERWVAAAHSRSDANAFAAAWAAGRALTLEQAIAYALEGSHGDSAASIGTTSSRP